jgi:hypothetical protein
MVIPPTSLYHSVPQSRISRRTLLKSSSALALGTSVLPPAQGMAVDKPEANMKKNA